MTQNEIIEAIKAERIRQDELHPLQKIEMLGKHHDIDILKIFVKEIKIQNDIQDDKGHPNWLDIFKEELYEIFAETDPAKIKEEAIQLAALCVRLCETL